MDTIKKLYSSYPKDNLKRLEKEVSDNIQANGFNYCDESILLLIGFLNGCIFQVEELTRKFVKKAEDLCKAKEKEIAGG